MMIGIGVDIGATNTKVIAMDSSGKLLKQERFHTLSGNGRPDFIRRLVVVIRDWKKEFGEKIVSIGVGAAGDVDPVKGIIRFSPNLDRRKNISVTKPLEKATGLPCVIENDANMAAWGAYEIELKKKCRNLLAITLGTGIGGGLIVEGRLYHGATGSAGEIGHIKIAPAETGEKCNCGGRGCLEAYCGSRAVIRDAKRLIRDIEAFAGRYSPVYKKLNMTCLSAAAGCGNAVALKLWRRMGRNLGLGLADIVLLVNPDCIVFTGGVSRASGYFMDEMKKVFREQQIKTSFGSLKIHVSKNADLGSYGAALFGLERAGWKGGKRKNKE